MLAAFTSVLMTFAGPTAAPPSALPEALATPALYVIRDSDTTIYLFGTFHVLDPKIRWLDGKVADAFAQSDELVVETIPVDRPAIANPVAPAGPIGAVTASADFFGAARQAVRAGRAQGMSLDSGADMVLLRAAAESGKAVEQLETISSQLGMMAALPHEVPQPTARTKVAATLRGMLDLLQAAWTRGDPGLFATMTEDMRAETPKTFDVLFADRNARWSDWVVARMRSPGTAFVAVGAGHLAGSDSLLVRLAERGYISRRVY